MASFMAKMRYGADTDKAFVCKEFLLPEAHTNFLNGRGLPPSRSKCLICSRYFQNWIYILVNLASPLQTLQQVSQTSALAQARTDPDFKIENSPLGMQVFANVCAEGTVAETSDAKLLRQAQKELPTHCSYVNGKDGYKAEAMLFVDEDWVNMRAARETKLGTLLWSPVVRFCSKDYEYVKTRNGHKIVQVGIGIDDKLDGLHFRQPPQKKVVSVGVSQVATRK